MMDSTNQALDFKQLRLNGDNLLGEYKKHSKDLLENTSIKEMRESLMLECEHHLAENSSSSTKIVDFIWKYCFYDTISASKSQRKKFTASELDLLQAFFHSGIDYFDDLGSRFLHTKYKCLLYKGDLLRYEHKLINKTEEDVLEIAEECYRQAVYLDSNAGSAYSKLACIYESKSPHIALNFLLRAIINKASSAVGSLSKLGAKNVPSGLNAVFELAQSVFQESDDQFHSSLDSFKQFMDTTMPANILIQNLHTACLLSMAIEEKGDMLKALISAICQYFNHFVPILIDQLNKTEILEQRRNCPSPFEDEDVGDLNEAYAHLGLESEPTLYENVLYPIVPLILTLNEWIAYLSSRLASLKLSVGSRMMCQSVLHKYADLLNCFIDVFGYRVEKNANDWRRASKWLSTHLFSLKKSQAFSVLIDSLKQSIDSSDHPLDFEDGKFKCSSSIKDVKQKTHKHEDKFIAPDYLIASTESWLNHWSKLLFVLDNIENPKMLTSSNTIKQLEQRSTINVEYTKCLEYIERLENKCLFYDDNMGNCVQMTKLIGENASIGSKQIALIVESFEFLNERNTLTKNVVCYSTEELYTKYCNSVGLNNDFTGC